jgi:hypothetical protein
MTHVCCTNCRLRFTPAVAAHLVACPECGELPQPAASGQELLGFRLVKLGDVPTPLPQAIAAALALPDPDRGRS